MWKVKKKLLREKEMKDDKSTSRKKLNFVTCGSCFGFVTMCVVRAIIALCTVITGHKFINSSLLTGSHSDTKTTVAIIIAFCL